MQRSQAIKTLCWQFSALIRKTSCSLAIRCRTKSTLAKFVNAYDVMHRWRKMPDGTELLLVGADNFPFPIPLKQSAGGPWFFDTAAGKEEILSRRIGRNELAVIEVCGALADAQAQYFSQVHADGNSKQYALKFISDAGKQNGLYWESQQGQPAKPTWAVSGLRNARGIHRKAGRAPTLSMATTSTC